VETEVNELTEARKKRKIRIFAGIFFGILLMLTLFSNTLLTLTLPKVLTELPVQGSLSHIIEGNGILKPIEAAELKDDTGWKVKSIRVKKGDRIVKGQVLITYESKIAELQIEDERTILKQQSLRLEGLFESFVEASRNGDPKLIESTKRELEIQRLEIETHERKIQTLQEYLENNQQILAPFAGIVTKVNAIEGLPTPVGLPAINLSNTSKGFSLTLMLTANQAALLNIGDSVDVDLKTREVKTIIGEITEIQDIPSEDSIAITKLSDNTLLKSIHITLQDASLKGDEKGSIKLTRSASNENETVLISNEAIHEDRDGKFVLLIEERMGALGNSFYIRKSYIEVMDKNETETAVLQGVFLMDKVIKESSEPLQEGDRIRLR
jgi:HlyD family secretion protein